MTDPVFQGHSTSYDAGGSSVSSMTVTMDVNEGDLVLAIVQRENQANCTGVTLGSQDLSFIKEALADYIGFGVDIWGCISDSSGTGVSITASYSDSGTLGEMSAVRWNNVASAEPSQSSCNIAGCYTTSGPSTERSAQEITTSARSLIVGIGTEFGYYHNQYGANGFTNEWSNYQWAYDKVADAGSFGGASNFGTTDGDADIYVSVLLAFNILPDPSSGEGSVFRKFRQFRPFQLS
jgi:hypothetical protein